MLWLLIALTFGFIFFIALFGNTEKKRLEEEIKYFKEHFDYDYK